jgi:hypothetical protein
MGPLERVRICEYTVSSRLIRCLSPTLRSSSFPRTAIDHPIELEVSGWGPPNVEDDVDVPQWGAQPLEVWNQNSGAVSPWGAT